MNNATYKYTSLIMQNIMTVTNKCQKMRMLKVGAGSVFLSENQRLLEWRDRIKLLILQNASIWRTNRIEYNSQSLMGISLIEAWPRRTRDVRWSIMTFRSRTTVAVYDDVMQLVATICSTAKPRHLGHLCIKLRLLSTTAAGSLLQSCSTRARQFEQISSSAVAERPRCRVG